MEFWTGWDCSFSGVFQVRGNFGTAQMLQEDYGIGVGCTTDLVVCLYDISVGLNIKKKGKGIVRRNFSVVVFVEGGLSRVTELHS